MKNVLLITGLLSALAPVLAGQTHAAARNFFTPTVGGDRLSFCVNTGTACGKPIADAWCKAIGFQEAINYQRNQATTTKPGIIRYADTGAVCSGPDCESFRQIKCWRTSKSDKQV